jgi:hypothetical protein
MLAKIHYRGKPRATLSTGPTCTNHQANDSIEGRILRDRLGVEAASSAAILGMMANDASLRDSSRDVCSVVSSRALEIFEHVGDPHRCLAVPEGILVTNK